MVTGDGWGQGENSASRPQAANYRPQTVTDSVEYAKGRQSGLFMIVIGEHEALGVPRLEVGGKCAF